MLLFLFFPFFKPNQKKIAMETTSLTYMNRISSLEGSLNPVADTAISRDGITYRLLATSWYPPCQWNGIFILKMNHLKIPQQKGIHFLLQ